MAAFSDTVCLPKEAAVTLAHSVQPPVLHSCPGMFVVDLLNLLRQSDRLHIKTCVDEMTT